MDSAFNYPHWFSLLSEKGFGYCRNLIYPLMNYKYIAVDQVRPVDISEKMYEFSSVTPMADGGSKEYTLICYVAALQNYILHYFKCKAGSRAEKYAKYTETLIRKFNDGSAQEDDLLTLFAIYLSIARVVFPNFETQMASDIDLSPDQSDAELLIKLRKHPFKRIVAGLPLLPGREERQSQERRNMIFMHNALMWSILMDRQGRFAEEE